MIKKQTTPTQRMRPLKLPVKAALLLATLALATAPLQAQSVKRNLDDLDGWTITAEPTPGTPEYGLYEIRRALADQQYKDAENKASKWIESNPAHPLIAEAYVARGESKQAREDYYHALFDYEFVARSYPSSEAFRLALEHEFEIAVLFANGTKRKIWGMRIAGAQDEAEELLIRIQERLPGSELAERAGRELADFYYRRRDMEMAATAYDLYIQNYQSAEDRVEAMKQLIYSHLAKSKGPKFDPSGLYEADAWLETISRAYPAEAEQMGAEALRVRIRESDADRMLEDARWYLKRDDKVSARFVLKRLLKKFPATASGQVAYRYMLDKGWITITPSTPDPNSEEAADNTPAEDQAPDSTTPDTNDNP